MTYAKTVFGFWLTNAMLIILLALFVFMVGCTNSQYRYKEFVLVDNKPKLMKDIKWNYSNANLGLKHEGLKVELPAGAKLEIGRREQIPDPNSIKEIGKAVGVIGGSLILK